MAPNTTIHRLGQVRRDERGFSLVTVGFGFMGMFAASMLAIDVGMLMTARSQAQNAADAGALAGATALMFNNFTDHSANGPAKRGAINTAKANLVAGQAASVMPEDVTFPFNAVTGQYDQVAVTVHRTTARSNPVGTLIAQLFGMDTVDVTATATATAYPADTMVCPLPFTIPDKWTEKGCGSPNCDWTPEEEFNMFATVNKKQNTGDALATPDIYIAPGTKDATGYDPVDDRGLQLVLKANNDTKVSPSMYNAWDLPGSTGADDYRMNIAGCNPNLIQIGYDMTPEPGNMTGPTSQGTKDLIDSDPNAYWDSGCKCVKGSAFFPKQSPRVRAVPLYDPVKYADGQKTGKSQPELEVVNYLGFFVEEVNGGGEVIGRVTPIIGKVTGVTGPAIGAFAQSIMLVK